MKNITIVSLMLTLLFSACSKDFITLSPEDSLSPSTFFQTEDQMRQAVIAAYVPLRSLLVNDYFTSEMRSDNSFYEPFPTNRGTATVQRENIANWTDDPTNAYTNAVYFHCYSGISRANIVIGRLPDAAGVPEEAKKDIQGQAKFLRAFNYFKLVRLFGDVPLYLTEVSKTENAYLPRATVEQVYAQIIADAQDAINALQAPTKFPQSGLATKGSATMLLAEVFMTQKKYAEAEQLLLTLEGMGYALNAAYEDAFSITNKNSKESIFEVQYLGGTAAGSQPSNFIYQFLPRTTSSILITGTATNTSGGGWNIPTQDLIDSYEPGDKRLEASIAIAEGTYNTSSLLIITANKSIVNYQAPEGKIGVPYIKKYLNLPHSAPNNTDDNWPIYRYADALLLLAEAQNELNKPVQALANVNKVRDRAFGAGVGTLIETNQALLSDIIAHERRIELAFENHRWHDLVRTDNALPVMSAYGVKAKATHDYLPGNAFIISPERFLFPIPQSEREINPDLTQNPGYF